MLDLCLHTGAHRVDRDAVGSAPIVCGPRPPTVRPTPIDSTIQNNKEILVTTAMLPTLSPLVDRWHRQIGRRLRLDLPVPRPFAAFDVLAPNTQEMLVPIERLTFVLLLDVVDENGDHRLRFAGYGARRIPWGVALGGAESQTFEKNLVLEPLGWARDERLDASSDWMLQTALRMDRRIERHARTSRSVGWDRPVLPAFWAAFPADVADEIACEGPELNGLVHETGRTVADLVAMTRRLHKDHVLLPLAWVSHVVEQATAVFADLQGLSRRQLFRLGDPTDALVGFRGACQIDFLANRFTQPEEPPLKETA